MLPHAEGAKNDAEDVYDYDKAARDYEKLNHVSWWDKLLLNRSIKVIPVILIFGVLAPALLYQYIFFVTLDASPPDGLSLGSCLVLRASRIPCSFSNKSSDCHRQCCYDSLNHACFHRFPSRFTYVIDEEEWSEDVVMRPRVENVPFRLQNSTPHLKLSIDEVSSTHLTIAFYNPNVTSINGSRIEEKKYVYHVLAPELNVMVNGSSGNLFNTVRGPFIASENIWEMVFKLTDEVMYGLGEMPLTNHSAKVIYNYEGGVNTMPLIFAKSNGSFHGLLFDVNSPTEVTITERKQIIVRSITNKELKFHIFVGPTPKDIMKDVMKHFKFDKKIDYWMLGTHVCTELEGTIQQTLQALTLFLREASNMNFALDSHCAIGPLPFDPEVNEATLINRGITLLTNNRKRFVTHIAPHIFYVKPNTTIEEIESTNSTEEFQVEADYDTSLNETKTFEDYLIRDSEANVYWGSINGLDVVYPDYTTTEPDFFANLWRYTNPVGAIVEDSWPLDESEKNHNLTSLTLPYFSEELKRAFNYTLPWDLTRVNGEKHVDRHNEYGNEFIEAFRKVFNTNLAMWSSSPWMNGDIVVNRQNVRTTWSSLHEELTKAALGGISGHWLWSSPICGDTVNFDIETHAEICVNWYAAAAYLPMIKIHSKIVERHPTAFVGANRQYILRSLTRRHYLLPYYFTTLQEGPLLRPMFYQYPDSEELSEMKSQFSVGDDLLIAPNLQPLQSHVHLRKPVGAWYEIWSGVQVGGNEEEMVTMTSADGDLVTLIRGGSILVMQKTVRLLVEETRINSDYALTVALSCNTTVEMIDDVETSNTTCNATGHHYINNNMTIIFEADAENLTVTAVGEDFQSFCGPVASKTAANRINEINIYGLDEEHNNFDNFKRITNIVDLCQLQNEDVDEIVIAIS